MGYYSGKPSEILKPYIKLYWAVENAINSGEQYSQRVVPSGLPELTIYLHNRPKVYTENRNFEDNVLLNGQQNNYFDIVISENLSVFSISFQPQGISQFFDLPLNELLNNNVPLKYIDKVLYLELEARLSSTKSFQEKISIVEECFISRLANNSREYNFQRIKHTIDMIRKFKGNISIDFLASESCLSRKQFERVFLDYIGISPKQYLKTIRFQASVHLKSRNGKMMLTELAYESGYYDQAHFINDYKSLTGLTPKKFFGECDNVVSDFFE